MLGVFWLTTECNMECVYCYEGNDKENLYMDKNTSDIAINFLIQQMKEKTDKRLNIEFHGGEPFLAYDRMVYIVKKIKQVCEEEKITVRFGCTTNATLLDEERLCFINKEINDFSISMDGAKFTHNYSRIFKTGKKTYDIVEKWLSRALELDQNIRVRMTFNHITVCNFFENIKYFNNIGVHYIVPTRDFFDTKFGEKEFEILKEQLLLTSQYIKTSKSNIHVSLLERFPIKKMGTCSGGIDSFHIDPKGNLYPCALAVGNNEFLIGNVINGVDVKKRDHILEYSKKDNSECIGCGLYDYCEQTRCRIVNRILTGDFCKPSPIACAENQLLLKLI